MINGIHYKRSFFSLKITKYFILKFDIEKNQYIVYYQRYIWQMCTTYCTNLYVYKTFLLINNDLQSQ